MTDTLDFKYLTPADKEAIVALRKESYADYYGSQVDLNGLNWNRTDQNSVHLAYTKGSEIVSYLRLSFFQSQDLLERTTLFPTPEHLEFPVAMLARAATKKEFLGHHLHNTLRLFALEACLSLGIKTVLGSLEERSARMKSLVDIGYQVYQSQPTWEGSYLQSTGPVVLIGLESAERIQDAIDKIRTRYQIKAAVKPPREIALL